MWLKQPIVSISDIEVFKKMKHRNWKSYVIDTTYPACDGPPGLAKALSKICEEADKASNDHQILILSDRKGGRDRVPISSLLALGNYLYTYIFSLLYLLIIISSCYYIFSLLYVLIIISSYYSVLL